MKCVAKQKVMGSKVSSSLRHAKGPLVLKFSKVRVSTAERENLSPAVALCSERPGLRPVRVRVVAGQLDFSLHSVPEKHGKRDLEKRPRALRGLGLLNTRVDTGSA